MHFEVELKFPAPDLAAITEKLAKLGAVFSPAEDETDMYFAHPSRDFAKTDEALRLRRKGDSNYVTYKGPKLDATTKTRKELELPLAPGADSIASWTTLLEAVGFRPVAEVHKLRRKAMVKWEERAVEVSLDQVDGVGSFLELELIADAETMDGAKACITSLAQALGLKASERRSYLELLLESRPAS